ncbi:MAG: hydrogenase [Planctomycetes bacterium]|jgi:hydrogenase-4 component E|nr:hydrogenase [Planctomycetota bacterium]
MVLLDPLLILALALNFVALGVGRTRAIVNAVALQGIILGILALFVHEHIDLRTIVLVLVTVGLKGFGFPALLAHAMREAQQEHEVKPLIDNMTSLLLGAVGTALAMVFSSTLPLADQHTHLLVVPASLATVWTGLLLLTTRKRAITQVLGYLLLENGIFLFGLLLLEAMPFLVEIGVLLDLFTGVFVMGIIIHHISREFPSISTDHLTKLKD